MNGHSNMVITQMWTQTEELIVFLLDKQSKSPSLRNGVSYDEITTQPGEGLEHSHALQRSGTLKSLRGVEKTSHKGQSYGSTCMRCPQAASPKGLISAGEEKPPVAMVALCEHTENH